MQRTSSLITLSGRPGVVLAKLLSVLSNQLGNLGCFSKNTTVATRADAAVDYISVVFL